MRRPMLHIPIAALVCLAGCSDRDRLPATYPVRGRILLDGKPVDAAEVSFVPSSRRAEAKPAHGRTNANGEFTIKTYFSPSRDAVGALADRYAVTVAKMIPPAVSAAEEGVTRPKNELPARYAALDESGLTAEVVADRANHLEFQLRSP